jgi:hypothetical protein
MNSAPVSQAKVLLIKAAEDEKVLDITGISDAILGFHAQQAVEKLIKALLSQLDVPYERTHDLGRLNALLALAGESLPPTPLALSELNDFAVIYRYDLLLQASGPDSSEVIETVRTLRQHIAARISALSAPPSPPPLQ